MSEIKGQTGFSGMFQKIINPFLHIADSLIESMCRYVFKIGLLCLLLSSCSADIDLMRAPEDGSPDVAGANKVSDVFLQHLLSDEDETGLIDLEVITAYRIEPNDFNGFEYALVSNAALEDISVGLVGPDGGVRWFIAVEGPSLVQDQFDHLHSVSIQGHTLSLDAAAEVLFFDNQPCTRKLPDTTEVVDVDALHIQSYPVDFYNILSMVHLSQNHFIFDRGVQTRDQAIHGEPASLRGVYALEKIQPNMAIDVGALTQGSYIDPLEPSCMNVTVGDGITASFEKIQKQNGEKGVKADPCHLFWNNEVFEIRWLESNFEL